MNRLENIAVGDIVLVESKVTLLDSGWGATERKIYVPMPVIGVSKTQIKVEGGRRFMRESGSEYGVHYSYAYPNQHPYKATPEAVIQRYEDIRKASNEFERVLHNFERQSSKIIKKLLGEGEEECLKTLKEVNAILKPLLAKLN